MILDKDIINLQNRDVIIDILDARLRISKKERRSLSRILTSVLNLFKNGVEELNDEDLIFTLAYEAEEDIYGVAAILMAYNLAGRLSQSDMEKTIEGLLWIHTRHQTIKNKPLPVTGHDIIEMSGLRPGPMIGILLEKLEKQIILNRITDRTAAIEAVREWMAESEWTAS